MNPQVREREQREREAFSKVAVGRSRSTDQELVIAPSDVERYRACVEGRKRPLWSIERMFALAAPHGKRVLEICGHDGHNGALLAMLGGDVDTVDIAAPIVELARRRIAQNGLEYRLRAHVMSVHEMTFPDASFDLVFGKASLHHLDLELARREIYRVLKPGGCGVFSEPTQLLPGMRVLRALVPVTSEVESPDERPLSKRDLDTFCRPFSKVELFPFRLFARLERLVPRWSARLARNDARIFDSIPQLSPLAGCVAFRVTK